MLIYFIKVWEYGAVQIISDATGLTGYRFPLCLAQSPVMGVKMAEIALVACDGELGEQFGGADWFQRLELLQNY